MTVGNFRTKVKQKMYSAAIIIIYVLLNTMNPSNYVRTNTIDSIKNILKDVEQLSYSISLYLDY